MNIGDFERRPEILRAQRHLQGDDGAYVPTYEEVATVVGVRVDQVRRVLAPPRFESVQHATSEDGGTSLAELVETEEIGPESAVVSSMALSALKEFGLSALDPRELYVLVRRFGLDGEPDEKLADIGETLSLSREAVRQIEAGRWRRSSTPWCCAGSSAKAVPEVALPLAVPSRAVPACKRTHLDRRDGAARPDGARAGTLTARGSRRKATPQRSRYERPGHRGGSRRAPPASVRRLRSVHPS